MLVVLNARVLRYRRRHLFASLGFRGPILLVSNRA
uniref:26S protease regulatory subunit 6A homolog n=1 Tax=Rhizophora mucronata TaxID=61149 RepID=A0A2P2IWM9_RHIMU